ncbi:HAD-IB family hydrolase [Streptomyces sp. NBC_01136]|uniref:HAD family hydrolase n=1 Tax=unclassified Streptomyces TaxID=2593676 RepID=UPI003254EBE8|nr:HAD-IB family hydrolase [Streptomyces sp. NBC_01136]
MSLAVVEGTGARERKHRPAYLVFCDVDETLIDCKSMFEFLRFQLVRRYGADGEERYRRIAGELRRRSADGAPRERVNREYYRAYAGESVAEMTALGREWFALASADPGFFISETVAALARHRAAGAEVVLVSGSFLPCLAPVAERVGAVHVLCTSPLVVDGRYTGEVLEPVIGEGKRSVALRMLAEHPGVNPQDCFAYGDHPSDFPLLDCVGNPRAVGYDPAVREYLARRREQERPTRSGSGSRSGFGSGSGSGSGCALACWSMGRDELSETCSGDCALPLG